MCGAAGDIYPRGANMDAVCAEKSSASQIQLRGGFQRDKSALCGPLYIRLYTAARIYDRADILSDFCMYYFHV